MNTSNYVYLSLFYAIEMNVLVVFHHELTFIHYWCYEYALNLK